MPTPEVFAQRLLAEECDALIALCQNLFDGGLAADAIYQGLLAPTARLMGDAWREDRISFTDATIGLGRLRSVVYGLSWATPYNGDKDLRPKVALFAAGPGEEQTFGFYLVEENFRWSGWRTVSETPSTTAKLVDSVRCNWFDIFCLSVNRLQNMEELTTMIDAIRRASLNANLSILVEGRTFIEQPELAMAIGAKTGVLDGGPPLHVADNAVWPPTSE